MSLFERIEEDFKNALRAKAADRLSALRMIKAALQNKKIENRGRLDEKEILATLSTLAKQRKESIEQYKNAKRDDLAKKEADELTLIEAYLPQQLSEAEVEKLVDEALQETGAKGPQELGNVMKALMPKLGGKADGKLVNALVRKKLGG
ncbi:MAG: GatB/YqeY domain-containing protein [Deltaproteobacteria bacterium]|nr:GatB/YqeY domain-containing protein [Deltaproteobacteria bacterium]